MQPCRCLQECHTGGCLHHDHHRLWLGRCSVCCPCSEILCQPQHGLPETAAGIRKTWCWSGTWTRKKSCETQLQVRSWATSHYSVVCVVWLPVFALREWLLSPACSTKEIQIDLKVTGNTGWEKGWSTASKHLLPSCAVNLVVASCELRHRSKLTPLEG